ncbi:MAG TPA: SAM-dependent methyltransferase, partial [Actinomycetes bacterium]|nr:SAM-dependent methyltransferase [Actinomycetes bacterium]
RLAALATMKRLLNRQGRLVLTSRTWELVRAGGSHVDVRDRLVSRRGRDAVVIYAWQIEPLWDQEHHLEIAVAQVDNDGSVHTSSERLSFWPYRYEELVAELRSVGLELLDSTFDPKTEGYMVVAGNA